MTAENKRLITILSVIFFLLLIPFIAMQFTDQVIWTGADFLAMGILLLSTGLACEFVLRKVKKAKYRVAICIVVLALFLLTWLELAVGIFGTPFAGS